MDLEGKFKKISRKFRLKITPRHSPPPHPCAVSAFKFLDSPLHRAASWPPNITFVPSAEKRSDNPEIFGDTCESTRERSLSRAPTAPTKPFGGSTSFITLGASTVMPCLKDSGGIEVLRFDADFTSQVFFLFVVWPKGLFSSSFLVFSPRSFFFF